MKPIMSSTDWNKDRLVEIYNELERLNEEKYKFDIYPNQIEIVPYSWMIDNHTTHGGMPVLYKHWSFGKAYVSFLNQYRSRQAGLAYEMVLNSNPTISYLMEENTEMMQCLVMAHAGFGHNTVFKNNYLFKEWTDAAEILDYLEFSKNYISRCEEKYGEKVVEDLLDVAHMLQFSSFTRYPRKRKYSVKENEQRRLARIQNYEQTYREIWDSVPKSGKVDGKAVSQEYRKRMHLPEENILYFLEKFSPNLAVWQREIIRIVRSIGQYFYPNIQTNIVHEGAATKTHYDMLNDLHKKGLIDNGAVLEWLHSHSSVVYQPDHTQKFTSHRHFNPYALGFAIAQDIERICNNPTQEDREWFPEFAGCKDPINQLKKAWYNSRDESYIREYLSPKVMRDLKMFSVLDDSTETAFEITHIHDEQGYKHVRSILADSLLIEKSIPNVEVVDANVLDDRKLTLEFRSLEGKRLYPKWTEKVLQGIANVWGYPVTLNEYSSFPGSKEKVDSHEATPKRPFNENS